MGEGVSETGQRRRGCLGCGCLTASLLFIVVVSSIGIYISWSIRSSVDRYTSTARPDFDISLVVPDHLASPDAKFSQLDALIADTRAAGAVTFSRDEVASASLRVFRGHAQVVPEGDALNFRFMFQLKDMSPAGFSLWGLLVGDKEERFVTGSGRGSVVYQHGAIIVSLNTFELGSRQLEDQALAWASEWIGGALTAALAATPAAGPQGVTLLSRLDALTIKDSGLTIALKAALQPTP